MNETFYFCIYQSDLMKNSIIILISLLATILISGCSKNTTEDPCDGKGTINVENKLDSAISVKIVQTHSTVTLEKDYTRPFSLTGNQPYTLTIDGPNYHMDCTLMVLPCDNKLMVIIKP